MYRIALFVLFGRLAISLIGFEIVEMQEHNKISNWYKMQELQSKEGARCVSFFGREEMTKDKAKFIWNSAVEFYNGIVNIPDEVLSLLRYVTRAVQPEDYHNMIMKNMNVIKNFGLNYGLKDDQLKAIAKRVRNDLGVKEPEDYTRNDLEALKQILCAFNRSEIERIPLEVYKEAAAIIGKLRNYNTVIMRRFVQLAPQKGVFGSSSQWTNATANIVGAV